MAASSVLTPSSLAKSTKDCLSKMDIVNSSIFVSGGIKDSSRGSQPSGSVGNAENEEEEEAEEEE